MVRSTRIKGRIFSLFGKIAIFGSLAWVSACAIDAAEAGNVVYGNGDSHSGCPYAAFEVMHQNPNDYVIAKVLSTKTVSIPPDPYASNPHAVETVNVPSIPVDGASITGNFSGFGDRILHNASNGSDLRVNVIYHAETYAAILNELGILDC